MVSVGSMFFTDDRTDHKLRSGLPSFEEKKQDTKEESFLV